VSKIRLEGGSALRILDSKQDFNYINTIPNLPTLTDFQSFQQIEKFNELIDLLKSSNINLVHNKKLVRGLDYYNGTCFEIKCLSSIAN
jgi:histidyl-tRNA synthetase